MGIARSGARMLLDEARNRPFGGKILQLGRQHLFLGETDLDGLAQLHGVRLRRDVPSENVFKPMLDPSYIDDGSFFTKLGFSTVESLDFSTDEAPTFIHDLNLPIPGALLSRYDAVYDGGTIEHVFDIRSVMRNIFMMLKVGGRIIHSAPSNNHVDHGFYMFSPTFFYDYYAINEYKIHECRLFTYYTDFDRNPWTIYDYEPGCLDHISFGGFKGDTLLAIYVSAEKTEASTWDRIPQQGMYARRWKDRVHDLTTGDIDRRTIHARPSTAEDPIPNKIVTY